MKRILITGAGGAPALNFTRSLAAAPERMHLIGIDCNKYYLKRSECDERHLVPRATDDDYMLVLKDIIRESGAEFIHTQNDIEINVLSEQRSELGVKYFLPSRETVRICMNKFETHKRWHDAGLPQPRTVMISDRRDLAEAFKTMGPRLWLRDVVGAAGKGSLPTSDPEVAQAWLDFKQGWGQFSAAEYLSPDSITWQSIWNDGELIVAQSRKRLYWEFADRAPSGITGLTGAGVTFADPSFDALAQEAILAIDSKPHGIFSVDMTHDGAGHPNPTEINIGRFFTTHEFFTQAGLNMPYIYVKLAHGEEVELPATRINPLPPDLLWIRGMDVTPLLLPRSEVEEYEEKLSQRIQTLKQK
jgi:carbamoyl-phosphate synthase large subunit